MTYSQYYIFDFLTDTGTQVWLLPFVSYPLTLHVYRCYYTGNKRCCYSPSMMQTLFHSVTGYCVLENLGLNEWQRAENYFFVKTLAGEFPSVTSDLANEKLPWKKRGGVQTIHSQLCLLPARSLEEMHGAVHGGRPSGLEVKVGGGSARMRVGSYVKKSHATAAANKEHEKLEIIEIIDIN